MVVVSLTTSPKRIMQCWPCLQSLLEQTLKPELIVFNLPHKYGRTGEKYVIPIQVRRSVHVNRCDRDWGPATKIVPTISFLRKRGFSENTRIIYLDDDMLYPSNMFETFCSLSSECVWALNGLSMPTSKDITELEKEIGVELWQAGPVAAPLFVDKVWQNPVQTGTPVDIVEAYGGICTTLSMFKDDFLPFMRRAMGCNMRKYAADVTLSNYFAKQGISRRLVYSDVLWWGHIRPLPWGLNEQDALQNGGALSETNLSRYLRLIPSLEAQNDYYFGSSRSMQCLQD